MWGGRMVVDLRTQWALGEKADAEQFWLEGDAPTSEQAPGGSVASAWKEGYVTDY